MKRVIKQAAGPRVASVSWTMGNPGRGLVDVHGTIHTWDVDQQGKPDWFEYGLRNRVESQGHFDITEDGTITNPQINWQVLQQAARLDPRLKVASWEDEFDDEEVDRQIKDKLLNPPTREEVREIVKAGWQPGEHGKAIEDPYTGKRLEWVVDEYGSPHHHDVEDTFVGLEGKQIIINPDGSEWSLEDDDDPMVGWTPSEETWAFSRIIPEGRWQWLQSTTTTS